jgi:hypothetical protein
VLRDLFAVVVLLLAMSPFTAPFQTCDAGEAIAIAAVNHDDDPGSLVAPLVPKAPHILIAPPAPISEVHQGLCAPLVPSGAFSNRVQHPPLRPTILRI